MEEIIGSTGEIGKLGYKIYNIGSHCGGLAFSILFCLRHMILDVFRDEHTLQPVTCLFEKSRTTFLIS